MAALDTIRNRAGKTICAVVTALTLQGCAEFFAAPKTTTYDVPSTNKSTSSMEYQVDRNLTQQRWNMDHAGMNKYGIYEMPKNKMPNYSCPKQNKTNR